MKGISRGLHHPQTLICFLLLALVACSRRSSSSSSPCIERYVATLNPIISATQLNTVDAYFSKNKLPTAGLQFISVDTAYLSYPGYTGNITQVDAHLFINGLPTFYFEQYFDFDTAGVLTSNSAPYHGAPANNDTTGHQSLASLRQLFLNNYRNCVSQLPIAHSVPVHPSVPYDDTCLLAQLGYVDASILHTGIPFNTLLLKAWMVYPASQSSNNDPYTRIYPCVTVIDNTGQPIADTLILY